MSSRLSGTSIRFYQVLAKHAGDTATAQVQFLFLDSIFQTLATIAQGLIDRLRAGSQTALQLCQGKADVVLALTIETIRQVHLVAHVLGHIVVERSLQVGQRVICRIGAPLGEQLGAVKLKQFFLTMRRIRSDTSTLCAPSRNLP